MAALSPVHHQPVPAITSLARSARRSWLWRLLAVAFLYIVVAGSVAHAQPREYQIKAVFLYNFLQFVEWPADAFIDDHSAVRIGVLGDDPFGAALEEAVRGETVNARRIEIVRSSRPEDLRDSHLLFVSKSETRRLDAVLSQFATSPVLTVGEADGFARRGGVVGFYSDGKKVRFEINVGVARTKGLKLSSQLLSLGRLIGAESVNAGGAP